MLYILMAETCNNAMEPFSYELLLDHLEDGVCFFNQHGNVVYWNQGAQRITGFSRDEVVGQAALEGPLRHLSADANPQHEEDIIAACLANGQPMQLDTWLKRKGGDLLPVQARISPIRDSRSEAIGVLEVFSDASARVEARHRIEELEEIALLCPLTEVGNRRYAEMALNSAMEELVRYGWRFSLLFVDLDHFKTINDVYGHSTGDEVLRMAAQGLKSAIRSFDFVGRWGGEEFLLILPNMTPELLPIVAERARRVLEESVYQTDGRHIQVTASIGATMARDDETVDKLIARADTLMYQAKQQGRNNCCYAM